jgi:predicted flap endonuclease-1-like 5' DNA nuclease
MNWAFFFAGIIVGWIIEWVVDLLFWRRRQKKWVAAESDYRTQLADLHTEVDGQKQQLDQAGAWQSDLVTAQSEKDELSRQLAAAQADKDGLGLQLAAVRAEKEDLSRQLAAARADRDLVGAQLTGAEAERQTLADRLANLSGLAAAAPAAAGVALLAMSRGEQVDLEEMGRGAGDDLTMIEGVGPKIQELLYQNGIHTYAELADSEVERLRAVLKEGGPAFRLADPTNWPRQARLAAAHDWVRLQTLKEQLSGGVRRPAEPEPDDDLTMIEGIGPAIAEALKNQGIRTFRQLARTDVVRLQAILTEAGPAFRLALPAAANWPQQAQLAADGAWDQLHALKDTLKSGRGGQDESEIRP